MNQSARSKRYRDLNRLRGLNRPSKIRSSPYAPVLGEGCSTRLGLTLSKINDVARPPRVKTTINTELLERIMGHKKSEAFIEIMKEADACSRPDDVILVHTIPDLTAPLATKFKQPIVFQHEGQFAPPLTITSLTARLIAQGETISVQIPNLSTTGPLLFTERTKITELRKTFRAEQRRTGRNYLDIHNSGVPFCPPPIQAADLRRSLQVRCGDVGHKDTSRVECNPEFFLLSSNYAVTPVHIDKAGSLTWVQILEGSKIWYFPKDIDDATIWAVTSTHTEPSEYPCGWIRVVLGPGDIFIMPPNFPHFVYSSEDCLAVGGHFYTGPHLGSSIAAVAIHERWAHSFNEPLQSSDYELLAKLVGQIQEQLSQIEHMDFLFCAYRYVYEQWPDCMKAQEKLKVRSDSKAQKAIRKAQLAFINKLKEILS